MKVIIVGAGIGGLTAALSLRHHGLDCVLLERAPELSEVGAGIQIAANGTIVLRELGLEPELAKFAMVPARMDYMNMETGRLMYAAPLGKEAESRYGGILYNVHRADLIRLLASALPAGSLRLGARCTSVWTNDTGAHVTLDTGEVIDGDIVVGADGIHSIVREAMRGPEEKEFTGILMWRSLIPASKLSGVDLPVAGNYWFGVGRNVVSYWVRKDLYSLLASVPAAEVTRESWTDSGDVDALRKSFEGAEPRVAAILDAVDSAFITGMYHRQPIDQWSQGRITLLGDAAHAMVPYLAQGACQAMEDAWMLAVCLSRHGVEAIPDALLEYQRRRQPRTTRIQAGARYVVDWAHEPDPDRVNQRNGRLRGLSRIDPLAETSWKFAWGHDVIDAARRPAGEVVGLSSVRESKRMLRPESQRAFDLWKGVFTPDDLAKGDQGQRAAYSRFLRQNFPASTDTNFEPCDLRGVPAYKVLAPGAKSRATVMHFHGGGYVLGSAHDSTEYASRLSATFDGPCYSIDYRLAPQHPYPAAIDDAFQAYRSLLLMGIDPTTLFISGESAGGGLALALGMALKRASLPLPAGIFALCPMTDLTLSGESLFTQSGDDPAVNRDQLAQLAASYFQGHEPTDPMVSPLFGDLTDLPPVFISAVRGESLESDATRFIQCAERSNCDVTSLLVDDSVHVFALFPFLPESEHVLDQVRTWSKKKIELARYAIQR